jgi:hypothetical protein
MENEKLKNLNNHFSAILAQRFEVWAESQGVASNSENLIKYLIGCSLIKNKQVNRFMVIDNYPKILEANEGRKERTIYTLEDIVYIKSTQIKTTLKHYSKTFRFNKKLVQ